MRRILLALVAAAITATLAHAADVNLLNVTDDVAEAVELARDCWERHRGESAVHEPEKADAQ